MKSILSTLTIILLLLQINIAQTEAIKVIKPLLLDKSVLSGVGLKKIDIAKEPEKQFYQKQLYRGEDISVYVVSTGSWVNKMDKFPFDEFVYMYHGEALVTPKDGTSTLFHTGDSFFAARGFTGEWEIKAGDHLHYELSVIATKRADKFSEDLHHQLFDKAKLSGTTITFDEDGIFEEVLRKGIELTVKLRAEKLGEQIIDQPSKEKMIQVLSGQISLLDKAGDVQVFYAGDFFVLPKGFVGEMKKEGHGLVKYLVVEKTGD